MVRATRQHNPRLAPQYLPLRWNPLNKMMTIPPQGWPKPVEKEPVEKGGWFQYSRDNEYSSFEGMTDGPVTSDLAWFIIGP